MNIVKELRELRLALQRGEERCSGNLLLGDTWVSEFFTEAAIRVCEIEMALLDKMPPGRKLGARKTKVRKHR
jgi:hypothetical protein